MGGLSLSSRTVWRMNRATRKREIGGSIPGSGAKSGEFAADPWILSQDEESAGKFWRSRTRSADLERNPETFPLIRRSCARSAELPADPGILARDGEIWRKVWRSRGRSADLAPDPEISGEICGSRWKWGDLGRDPGNSRLIGRSCARSREVASDLGISSSSWKSSRGRVDKKRGRGARPPKFEAMEDGISRWCRGWASAAPPGRAWPCGGGHGTAGSRSGPASPSGCRSGASRPGAGHWPAASLQ